jgi:tripartite-type tricarboxylate transporter receptor subunit TctC
VCSSDLDIVGVPYKGTGPAVNALLGGHVQLMFGAPSSVSAHVKSGRLKALAVTSPRPSALVPGLPTVAQTLSGYEMGGETALFAPRGTPAAIIARLNREIVALVHRPDIKERLNGGGVEAVGSSPEALASTIRVAMSKVGKLVAQAGIRAE